MATLYQYTLWLHISAGMLGLTLFWIPIIVKKGSKNHKRIGRWYLNLMTATGVTGLVMALMMFFVPLAVSPPPANFSPEQISELAASTQQRAAFFFLLAFLLIASAQRATLALVAKADRQLLQRPLHLVAPTLLVISAVYMAWLGLADSSVLYLVFAGLGLFIGTGQLWYAFKPTLERGEWLLEHIRSTLGSGIAAHTALFVFGAASVMEELFSGQMILLPWILPGVVGGTAIALLTQSYKRRLGSSRSTR